MENLIQHKVAIEELVGEYYDLQDRHWSENAKRKYFEKEVNSILYQWDKIRYSDKVKADIESIDP